MTWIEKRKSGWVVRFRERGRKYSSKPYPTKTAAQRAEDKIRARLADQSIGVVTHDPNPEGWTVTDLVEWASSTFDSATTAHYNAWRACSVSATPIDHLTSIDIERQLARWTDVGPATLNRRRGSLGSAYVRAKGLGYFSGASPVLDVKKRDERSERKQRTHISMADLRAILAVCDPEFAGVIALAGLAGLRKGEIAALTADDVDLRRNTLTVARSHGKGVTKGKRRDVVALHDKLVPILRAAVARQPTGRLFPRRSGKPVAANGDKTYQKVLEAAVARAGAPEVSLHGLRHSFITALAEHVPIAVVQLHARHSDVTTTMQYVHPDASIARAREDLNKHLSLEPDGVEDITKKAETK